MLKMKKEFIIGVFLSIIGVISFSNLAILQADSKQRNNNIVTFAKEHRVFGTYKLSRRRLNKTISRLEFQRLINKILFDLNVVKQIDVNYLTKLGIFSTKSAHRKISRKDGLGILLRSMIYIWTNNLSTVKCTFSQNHIFRDYLVAPKYSKAMNFALDKALIRGMKNGKFYPERRLKLKNALILAKRFYTIFNNKQHTHRVKVKQVVITKNSTPIKIQDKTEVFEYTNQDLKMATYRRVSVNRFSNLLTNILDNNNKSGYASEVKLLVKKFGARTKLKRTQLAILSAVLVRAFPHRSYVGYSLYSDVKQNTVIAMALQTLSKVGIRMGYPNGRFGGRERVTGYEALKLVQNITKNIEKANSTKVKKSIATRTDIQNLVNRIKAKRARIKRLFNRKS